MGLFDFLGPTTTSPSTYPAMEARRRIALQLLSNSKKGYPKTIGEGLTAIGDAIGDRSVLAQLAAQEAAYGKAAAADAESGIPAEARTTGPQSAAPVAAAAAVKPLAYADTGDTGDTPVVPYPPVAPAQPQTPVDTADLTPDEQKAGVVGSDVSVPDTATAGPQSSVVPSELTRWVAKKENFTPKAFSDYGTTNIGYGTSAKGRTSIDEPTARAEMNDELARHLATVDKLNPNTPPAIRNSLASLGYNTGGKALSGTGLAKAVQAGDWNTAEGIFRQYTKAGGQDLAGLVTRRNQEAQAFRNPNFYNSGGGTTAAQDWGGNQDPRSVAPPASGGRDALAAAVLQQQAPQPPPSAGLQARAVPAASVPAQGAAPNQSWPTMMGRYQDSFGGAGGANILPTEASSRGAPWLGSATDAYSAAPPAQGPPQGPAALSFSGLAPDSSAPSGLPPEITGGASIKPAPQPPLVRPMPPQPPPPQPPQQVAQAAPALRPPIPQDVRMNEIEKQGWRELAKARASGDPGQLEQAKALLQAGISQHNDEYNARMKDYQDRLLMQRERALAQEKFDRERPEREANIARTQQQTQAGSLIDPTDKPYVLGPDGVARPLTVTGGGAPNPKLTEVETKNLDYYQRGKRALADLGSGDELQNFVKWHAGGMPIVGNALVDAKYQEQLNAAKEFAAIKLRYESGAAVTANELSDVMHRYIPRPGDKPDLVTQKEYMRNGVVDALRTTLGKGSVIADKFDQNFPAERQRLQADKRQNVINADMEGVPKVEGVVKTNKKTGAKRMWDGTRWTEVP